MASDAATTFHVELIEIRVLGNQLYRFNPDGPQYWFNGVRDDDGVTTAMSIVENTSGSGLNAIVIGNNGAGTSADFLEGYLADFY